ncbi:MAG: arginyltransferase [Thermodesulfobacteriota bacterium]
MTIKRRDPSSIEDYLPFFYDIGVECPYGLHRMAIYRQQQFAVLPDSLLGCFFAAGFRRNGNCLYTMVCPGCQSCIPIRLYPPEFRANRSQKRVLRRNRDIEITMGPLHITEEKLALCGAFLEARFPVRGNTAVGYYGTFFANSLCSTIEIEYRLGGRLLGVGIVDIGGDWLNAVYCYYDPAEEKRGLGTFNILHLIDLCRNNDITALYLGYLIREVPAMNYKERFRPHYLLENGVWSRYDRS